MRVAVLLALTAAVLGVDGRSPWMRALVGVVVAGVVIGLLIVDRRAWERTRR